MSVFPQIHVRIKTCLGCFLDLPLKCTNTYRVHAQLFNQMGCPPSLRFDPVRPAVGRVVQEVGMLAPAFNIYPHEECVDGTEEGWTRSGGAGKDGGDGIGQPVEEVVMKSRGVEVNGNGATDDVGDNKIRTEECRGNKPETVLVNHLSLMGNFEQ